MPQFTPASVADAPALALLTQYFSSREQSFPPAQGTYHPTFPTPGHFLPPHGVFLLVSDDQPGIDDPASPDASDAPAHGRRFVGCGGIRRLDDAPAEVVRYEIKHLWLQPETRGRGWGRDLLLELERRAAEFGATEVVLDTNASLTAAGALYASAGYDAAPPYNDNPNATNWYRKSVVR